MPVPIRAARAALAALLALLLPAAAKSATVRIDYRISLAGLTLGHADLTGAFQGDRYQLRLRAQLTGLAGLFTAGGRGGAEASGAINLSRLSPASFTATGRSGSAERTVRMNLAAGDVRSVSIEPPFELRPDRVPLTEADQRSVTDPLSGVVGVVARGTRPDDPDNCSRTVPVFDGTQRFDVKLSYVETRPVQIPGYAGNVLVCSARYVPIAGHRPTRPAVKFMEENREISVWLAPVEGTRALVPLRISLATMVGTSVVEADRWSRD